MPGWILMRSSSRRRAITWIGSSATTAAVRIRSASAPSASVTVTSRVAGSNPSRSPTTA
jgi:hypothetical protein